jgi:hypothetical protein
MMNLSRLWLMMTLSRSRALPHPAHYNDVPLIQAEHPLSLPPPPFPPLTCGPQASGSGYVEMDHTKVLCAVYGPKPRQDVSFSERGKLLCDFRYVVTACLEASSSEIHHRRHAAMIVTLPAPDMLPEFDLGGEEWPR